MLTLLLFFFHLPKTMSIILGPNKNAGSEFAQQYLTRLWLSGDPEYAFLKRKLFLSWKTSCNFLQIIHLRDFVFTLTSLVKIGSVGSIFFSPLKIFFLVNLISLSLNFFIFEKYANLLRGILYKTALLIVCIICLMGKKKRFFRRERARERLRVMGRVMSERETINIWEKNLKLCLSLAVGLHSHPGKDKM